MGFFDIFFPKYCIACKRFGDYICSSCFITISFDAKRACVMCGKNSINGLTHPVCKTRFAIDGVFCATVYSKTIKKLIFRMKYKPFISDLTDTITTLFYESLIQQEPFMMTQNSQKNIFCVPVPLSPQKMRRRGYNQSELIGKNLSEKFGWRFLNCLERVRDTKPQFGLSKKERIENMKGAFKIKSEFKIQNLKNAVAFLIDDVFTTGTTIKEAGGILKKIGFEKVWAICLAGESYSF